MDFEETYGSSVKGFIHVHHIKPLSYIGKQYKVNPLTDLRPVCPNCHAVIHANGKVLSVTKARALMRRAARKNSN
ncbi:HNH endonuclease [Methylobacterium sp. J-068]|uniref:HNH endonuclease n=1 Tax=Methylobacterium sp. J-068 TaxID=2836649 RepID=UPI003918E108